MANGLDKKNAQLLIQYCILCTSKVYYYKMWWHCGPVYSEKVTKELYLMGLSNEISDGWKSGQTLSADQLYDRFAYFYTKKKPSREKQKLFSVSL